MKLYRPACGASSKCERDNIKRRILISNEMKVSLHIRLCIMHCAQCASIAQRQSSSIFQFSSLIIESFLIHIGQFSSAIEGSWKARTCRLKRATMAREREKLAQVVSNFILHCMLNQFSIARRFDKSFFVCPYREPSERDNVMLIVMVFKHLVCGFFEGVQGMAKEDAFWNFHVQIWLKSF